MRYIATAPRGIPEKEESVCRLALVQDGDVVDLVVVNSTGETEYRVLGFAPGNGWVMAYHSVSKKTGLPLDANGRLIVSS